MNIEPKELYILTLQDIPETLIAFRTLKQANEAYLRIENTLKEYQKEIEEILKKYREELGEEEEKE